MTPRAFIIHSDRKSAEVGRAVLISYGYDCTVAADLEEASLLLRGPGPGPQLLLLDPNIGSIDAIRRRAGHEASVILMMPFETLKGAAEALGANRGLTEKAATIAAEGVLACLNSVTHSLGPRGVQLATPPIVFGMIGTSPALIEVVELSLRAARSEANILLQGESGTGKELAAKAMHANSRRVGRPFVAIDCASLPENLLEAELFGYEKGAFTGAIKAKPGLMELADRGTLFLDEVGEIPVGLQAKLLRALQEREHRRVGGTENIKFDVRLIAATSRDLQQQIRERKFREDLFFRLNVIPIRLPALRDRAGDVPLLADYFLEQYSEADTGVRKRFDAGALAILESYSWPGNIRELQNVVRRSCVLAEGSVIQGRDLPEELISGNPVLSVHTAAALEPFDLAFMAAKRRWLNQFEAGYLRGALDHYSGNVSRAAEAADLDRKTFYRLMRKHHLQPDLFRTRHGSA